MNPLKPFALDEIARCERDPSLQRGIKIHFGNSDVRLDDEVHVEQLQRVFRAANDRGMAIVMGLPPAGANGESYSVAQARVFPERLLPDALLSVCVSRRKCHKPFELHCKEKCTRYCARTPTAFPVLSERSVRSAQHLEGDVPALVSHLLTAQDISPGDRDRIRAVLDATATPSEGAD